MLGSCTQKHACRTHPCSISTLFICILIYYIWIMALLSVSCSGCSPLGASFVAQWLSICLQCRRPGFDTWVGKIPWRRERLFTPIFWPKEFHGLYSSWGHKESDMTEQLSLHFKGTSSKESSCQWEDEIDARDVSSVLRWGRSPGLGNVNPF